MSLHVVDRFLEFAEQVVRSKNLLPKDLDAVELENAMVNLGVVMLYAHMEQCLRNALETKCHRCNDIEVRAFALSVKDEKTGRIGIDSVKGTLKRFGTTCRDAFREHLEASSLQDSWDSIMNQRAQVAHYGRPASITLKELRKYYEDICQVLGFICNSLGLTGEEVSAISTHVILPAVKPAAGATPHPTVGSDN